MDAYPQHYVAHNLPFVLLSGLETHESPGDPKTEEIAYPLLKENGFTIESDFPPLDGSSAEELRSLFLNENASRNPWDPWDPWDYLGADSSKVKYKIKSVGRVCETHFISFYGQPDTLIGLQTSATKGEPTSYLPAREPDR
jgi:hypothetical protein